MDRISRRRRHLLQAGVAGAVLPLAAWAQSPGAAGLLRLPRKALVIGNSTYRSVAALRNCGNDARAVSAALGELGFSVATILDADREAMRRAIEAYVAELAERKGIALFYFAGHGVQLAWRNFILPVDARVQGPGDIPAQGVEVGQLLSGLTRAGNPMNVIILDACRENPFGGEVPLEQKGLSQMDAPPGTLLAYATAPGHLASDGQGVNGLYTENLLREMRVREAKIEDVFKRVRLGVRRTSGGTQVPWESTSLEEDFYFVPPEALRRLSEQEAAREFASEMALYEAAVAARTPAALEGYLRRHPSGRFADLAQLRLDQALAAQGEHPVQPVSSPANPHSAGTARADTRFRAGDSFTYRFTGSREQGGERSGEYTLAVTAITESEVTFNHGEHVVDLLGNTIQPRDGRRFTPRQDQPLEYSVGRRWSTRFGMAKGDEDFGTAVQDFRIVAREKVTVPAGTFHCFRVEMSGRHFRPGKPPLDTFATLWMDPQRVRRWVARERSNRMVRRGHVATVSSDRHELVAFRQA